MGSWNLGVPRTSLSRQDACPPPRCLPAGARRNVTRRVPRWSPVPSTSPTDPSAPPLRRRCGDPGAWALRDVRTTHTVPTSDPAGVGRFTTSHVTERCTAVVQEAHSRVAVRTSGATTTVGWVARKRHVKGSDERPCLSETCSGRLGRLATEVTTFPAPGTTPPVFRVRCNGHNCNRFLVPCSCLAFVRPGDFTKADLHPATQASTVAGALDMNPPTGTRQGLLVTADRRDSFGCTPADRLTGSGDLVAERSRILVDTGFEDAAAGDVDVGDNDTDVATIEGNDEGEQVEEDEAPRPVDGGRVPHLQLLSDAKAAVVAAGDDPKTTQLPQATFKANAEELRTSKETFTGASSGQAGTVLDSPSSRGNKRWLHSPQDWCHGRDTQALETWVFRNQVQRTNPLSGHPATCLEVFCVCALCLQWCNVGGELSSVSDFRRVLRLA